MAYSNGYSYYREIVVDNTKVIGSANHSNFTIVVSGVYSYLADTSNSGLVENPSGNLDIRFELAGGTKLSHAIIEWVNTTGKVVFAVKIPTLYYSSDTTIRMYYGNSSLSSSEADPTNAFISGTSLFMPLNESSGTRYDIAGGNNTVTETSMGVGTGNLSTNAADFEGSSTPYSWVKSNDNASLDITDNITVTAWVKPESFIQWDCVVMKGRNASATNTTLNYGLEIGNGAGRFRMYWWDSAGTLNQRETVSTSVVSTGSWQFIGARGTFGDGSDFDLWYNSSTVSAQWYLSGNNSNSVNANSDALSIGARRVNDTPDGEFDGMIAFLRIYNGILSDDWLQTEYNNQNSPSTFYSVGSEIAAPSSASFDLPVADLQTSVPTLQVILTENFNLPAGVVTPLSPDLAVVVSYAFNLPVAEVTVVSTPPSVSNYNFNCIWINYEKRAKRIRDNYYLTL